MIECPVCKHQEFVGTLYCSECGARLVSVSPFPTVSISRDDISEEAMVTKPTVPEGPELTSGALIGLRVLSSGDVISLLGRDNYTLGRSGKSQAIVPDADLAAFDAYDEGVSRLHAEIRVQPDIIYLVDLDSANGTLLNGNHINPQEPTPIRHGDIIQLGRMRLQLISRLRK